jgi:hypothetical protein
MSPADAAPRNPDPLIPTAEDRMGVFRTLWDRHPACPS